VLYDWRPNLRAEDLILSVISILNSAHEIKAPGDNADVMSLTAGLSPLDIEWEFPPPDFTTIPFKPD
jgi:hypothetical protein